MNNQEAKFILGAYRPDGRDATDPRFAEALAQASRDPELRAWLERQRKFDATLGHKLRELAPPPGLREAILAGTRVSAPAAPRRPWTHPAWLAAAAAVIAVGTIVAMRRGPMSRPPVAELTALAARDTTEDHAHHIGAPGPLATAQTQFASVALPLTKNFSLDLEDLRRKGCRTLKLGGREVFELCFQRDGKSFHLYAAKRADFAPGGDNPWALLQARGQVAATAWSDAKNVYALVTDAGTGALERLI